MRSWRLPGAACAIAFAAAGLAVAQERGPAAVDGDRIANANSEPGQWMTYGRTYDEQRWSPLDQINLDTVETLGLAWYADIPLNQGQEATPLMIDGVIYLSSSWSNVFAYDAKTGEQLWRYNPEVPGQWGINVCCGVVNRGVAAWEGKIYVGTLDGRLVALDAGTGEEVWSVQTTPTDERYSITGAVRAVKGNIIVGNSGAEFGVRGYVSAYDAETGELSWRFYTVPGDPALGFENAAMEMAAETWNGEWWKLGGGGTAWDALVYDPVTDLLYIGVGNGSPWNAALRSPGGGDNLFLASIVAVDPDTGEYVWHYQTSPGETWDFTSTQPIMVADLPIDGGSRRVVMQAPKNGFFYVLDAATGEFISANNFAPQNWALGFEEDGTPIQNPAARFDQTGEVAFVTPTGLGAHNWRSMSYSPQTGLVYFPTRHAAQAYVGTEPEDFEITNVGTNTGLDRSVGGQYAAQMREIPELQFEDPGALVAWDPIAQRAVWRVVDPGGNYDGGALATAGGIVFAGGGGVNFNAYDATSGEIVWSGPAQTGVAAGAISYSVDGEQYVAVAAGRGLQPYYQPNYSRLLVFKLGGTAELPPPIPYVEAPIDPPDTVVSAEAVARGATLYGANCMQCHGVNGQTNGSFPDLRRTAALREADLFKAIVLEGALSGNGMGSFAAELDEAEAMDVHAYLISIAQAAKAQQAALQAPPAPAAEPHTEDAPAAEPHD